jgi:NAD(P)-dependent dehydrogenase (short-subunit alcohol dehydrogenase family)
MRRRRREKNFAVLRNKRGAGAHPPARLSAGSPAITRRRVACRRSCSARATRTPSIAGQAAYCAAKFGIVGLTKAAALDYAKSNIRVNVVCPGIIETPMMDRFSGGTPEGRARVIAQEPVGRMGKPEEIAAAVVYLCSDAAAFVVGHAMVIDGGQTV